MDIKDLEKNAKMASNDPVSAIKFFINCLYVYQQGNDKALGYVGYVLSKDNLVADKTSPSGFKPSPYTLNFIKMVQEPKNVNVIIAAMGANYENDYTDVDPDNYELNITSEIDETKDDLSVFIKSGGHDLPFPINVSKNNKGQWKITEFSSLVLGVRKPKSSERDF